MTEQRLVLVIDRWNPSEYEYKEWYLRVWPYGTMHGED